MSINLQSKKVADASADTSAPHAASHLVALVLPPPPAPAAAQDPKAASPEVQRVTGLIPPHLGRVEGTPVDGATRTFVVIREMHHESSLPADMQTAALRCQTEIADILGRVAHLTNGAGIFKDGMTPKLAEEHIGGIRQLRELAPSAKQIQDLVGTKNSADTERALAGLVKKGANPAIIKGVTFLRDYQRQAELISEQAATDGTMRLVVNGRATISGVEDPKLVDAAIQLAKDNPRIEVDDPRVKAIAQQREAHIITEVAKRPGTTLGVFGGSHSFKDEVAAHNKAHPDRAIQLIEVTPAEYKKFFRE